MGGKKYEKMLPGVSVLQMKKTYEAYSEVFNQLKIIGQTYNVVLKPSLGLTDFEQAAQKALSFNFPGIRL